jgi:hypothetical protein
LGFFTVEAALDMVKRQAVPMDSTQEERLKSEISNAVSYVSKISGRNSIHPGLTEIPKGNEDRLAKLQLETTFSEHTQGSSDWGFKMVELGKLRCFQSLLNSEYLDELKSRVPKVGDIDGLLRFCLPLRDEMPKSEVLAGLNVATNTFTVVSENLDLRLVGTLQGEDQSTKRRFVGFAFGFGLPQMSVAEFKGIHILKNGYHRAYALYQAGHRSIPVIRVVVNSYEGTGGARQGFFPSDSVLSDNGPTLEDFFSPACVTIPQRRMRVILTAHSETQTLPV